MRTVGSRRARALLLVAVVLVAAAAAGTLWALSGGSSGAGRDDALEQKRRGERILVDRPFRCRGRVDLNLVRVTMRTANSDAIVLEENCTGRIGRVEVETWTADGIKVQNGGRVAHDLVIESGYVRCHEVADGAHQDGIQVMGGSRLTFRELRIDCLGNANLFLSKGGLGASTPTDVVCEDCVLGPHSSQTLFYADSVRSGARSTTICTGRFRAVRVEPDARAIVEEGNTVLSRDDPACADVTGKGRRTLSLRVRFQTGSSAT
jgi:hypothetical protein